MVRLNIFKECSPSVLNESTEIYMDSKAEVLDYINLLKAIWPTIRVEYKQLIV